MTQKRRDYLKDQNYFKYDDLGIPQPYDMQSRKPLMSKDSKQRIEDFIVKSFFIGGLLALLATHGYLKYKNMIRDLNQQDTTKVERIYNP